MFIYTSPKGGSAMVESLPLARVINGVKKFKVVWSGGGSWYATKDELSGRLVNEDNIPVVAHAEFQADLEEILGSTAPETELTVPAAID